MLRFETLPASWRGLLVVLRPCFTRPSLATFAALVTGLVMQTGTRTVCGMLTGAGWAGRVHHSRAHWFFSGARWCADRVGLAVLGLIVARLLPAGAPLVVAVDDTLFRRRGRKVFGAGWHHDATSHHRKTAVAWGNNWVVAGVVVALPFASRPVCLPVAARLWCRGEEHKAVLARALVEMITAACPGRRVEVVADAFYGTRHWRGLDEQVSLTVRLRSNAALTEIHQPVPGVRGRPRTRGAKIGSPAVLATREHLWETVTVTRYGRTGTTQLLDYRCLWTGPLLSRPVRVILQRDTPTGINGRGYHLALLTTDLHTPAATILTRYATRWALEVAFHDAKHHTGAGHARNRTEQAVRRTVPFGLYTYSLVICWYTLTGHHPHDITHRRNTAPWYTTKTEPSYLDMITKLRRTIIATQFLPQTPRTPTHQETLAVHHAWTAAAA